MSAVLAGELREAPSVAKRDAAVAFQTRRRLMRVLASMGILLVVMTVIGLLLDARARHDYLVVVFTAMVVIGVLPVIASLLQYIVVGLHRYADGHSGLRAYYPRVAIVVPAWNEADVIGATIEQLLRMDYPEERLRVYVVDDASTDGTPGIVRAWESRCPDRVRHLRRDTGGEGKAHTLNHGIVRILDDPWAESVLIIDADVLFEKSTLRRMTRHLADPAIGAVTAYVKEGTAAGNSLTRFIGYEYITAQAASRRAQNVFGALACLAGGAQLHSRANLEAIGGRIDTASLAEDTVTTFHTQLAGKRVVFDGNAVVWAEEPNNLGALWKQRMRWARGNVQISLRFAEMWLRGGMRGPLGGPLFAFLWFTILLMPLLMIATSLGLIGLYVVNAPRGWAVFHLFWIWNAVIYVFITAMSFALDPRTGRRTWLQGILFPGVISFVIILASVFPAAGAALFATATGWFGVVPTQRLTEGVRLFAYSWLTVSMPVAYLAKVVATRWPNGLLSSALLYLSGYGAFLSTVTFGAYVKEIQGAGLQWDKTVKTGRATVPG